jgi:hypothetical protein
MSCLQDFICLNNGFCGSDGKCFCEKYFGYHDFISVIFIFIREFNCSLRLIQSVGSSTFFGINVSLILLYGIILIIASIGVLLTIKSNRNKSRWNFVLVAHLVLILGCISRSSEYFCYFDQFRSAYCSIDVGVLRLLKWKRRLVLTSCFHLSSDVIGIPEAPCYQLGHFFG